LIEIILHKRLAKFVEN